MEADQRSYTAFEGEKRFARGRPANVLLSIKALLAADPRAQLLVFDDANGRTVDVDLRGSDSEILARLAKPSSALEPRGPGRPRLGVVAREVTLLPRHWEWLNAQRGGASVTLRRLVEDARKADPHGVARIQAQESTDRFMATIAGNRPGYEDAARALYACDASAFSSAIAAWPRDIRAHVHLLAKPVFTNQAA